jgi:hypothetical protein
VLFILNFLACRSRVPNLDKQLTELHYQVQEDGETLEEGLEDAKYVLYNDMTYNWRAFRVAHQNHLNLFESIEIDAQRPGKSLLMAWREEKRKADSANEAADQDACPSQEENGPEEKEGSVSSTNGEIPSQNGGSPLEETIVDPLIPAKRQPMELDVEADQAIQKKSKIEEE